MDLGPKCRMAAVRVRSGRVKHSGGSGSSGGSADPCQAVQRFRQFKSNIFTVQQNYRVEKPDCSNPPKMSFFKFSKESGLTSSSKSRIKSTRVSGFVLIRLGARAMKNLFRKLLKSGPHRRRGITRGPFKGLLGAAV